ncbi:MAG TPA: hypothetical protein VFB72_07990, partial [Verrucomicrobiae bacterium]|nr:hypothetical protein [Verrucomicrobiae bacterium]
RMLEFGTKDSDRLDMKKMNVDSDRAISIATNQQELKGLTLRATQLWLQHGPNGPQWKVRVWAARLRNPGRDAEVGDVYISANDASVLKSDLHIGRVD